MSYILGENKVLLLSRKTEWRGFSDRINTNPYLIEFRWDEVANEAEASWYRRYN